MLFTLLLLLFTVLGAGVYTQDLKVTTTEGTVVGLKATDGDYTAFYGIPYAGSVSGKNRFKVAPEPPQHSIEFKADDTEVICAQPTPHGLTGKEDCLTLSIFTKNFTTPKPVIVWLDGEEYSTTNDTPRYSFKALVESDVVFIAVNYRLSVFGFLCLGVEDAPGNAGLKDVVKALKWIQKNVGNFGGEPGNVTLLGHGSGAAMVDLLTMSPQSEGLISKAVALSGSALSPWAIAYDPAGYAAALGDKLQYTEKTHTALAKLFQDADADVLVNEINEIKFANNSVLFAPCVENPDLPSPFLAEDPLKLLKSGKYLKIPYIAGYVSKEGTIRVREAVHGNWLKMMQKDFEAFLPANLLFDDKHTRQNISQNVRDSYFGNTADISDITPDNIQDYFAFQGDSLITVPLIRHVRERVKSGSESVRLLEFSYRDVNHDWPYPNIHLDGVPHGAILDYLFDLETRKVNDKPKKSLVGRLVAFARTGVPDIPSSVWLAYNKEISYYLSITGHAGGTSENPTPTFAEIMQLRPHDQSVNFWTNNFVYATSVHVSSAGIARLSVLSLILCFLTLKLL